MTEQLQRPSLGHLGQNCGCGGSQPAVVAAVERIRATGPRASYVNGPLSDYVSFHSVLFPFGIITIFSASRSA
jgi:hypothetical protein